MVGARFHLVGVLVSLAGLGLGCAAFGGREGGSARPGGTSQAGGQAAGQREGSSAHGQSSFGLSTPVDVSKLREQAMTLVESMSKSDDATIRANAVEAATYSAKRLRGIIDAGLTDRSAGVRSVAASAVAKGQIRELLSRVEPLLRDREPAVRVAAMHAMIKNGRQIDQTPLGEMLMSDPSPWVSRQAAYVLGETGNRSAIALLRSAANNRTAVLPPSHQRPFQLQVAEAMVKLGEQDQLPVLRASLYPSQLEDLEGAALGIQILGELRDRESIGQLMSVINYTDRERKAYPAEMRMGAAAALARMGIDNAAETADQYMNDQLATIRMQAATVYGSHPGPKYWDRLSVLMNDSQPSVRLAAAAGVLRSGAR